MVPFAVVVVTIHPRIRAIYSVSKGRKQLKVGAQHVARGPPTRREQVLVRIKAAPLGSALVEDVLVRTGAVVAAAVDDLLAACGDEVVEGYLADVGAAAAAGLQDAAVPLRAM